MISLLTLKTHIAICLTAIGLVTGTPAMGWATVPLLPTVTPVPTTATSVPFGSNDPDVANLAQFGYVQEEFFISSTVGGTPYTTRILVRRPANPKKFSGIIIAESIRSTAIRTPWGVRGYLMRSGHAYVELGSNLSGINRFVKPSDPTRYAAINLTHPAYPLLFGHIHEIMAQGGRLLKTNPPGGPFAGFRVTRVLLGGCSEQGLIVKMYMRDSHALYRMADGGPVYDGYFPACVADWPSVVTLDNGTPVPNSTSTPIDVPVINFATQAEPESWPQDGRLYRRPDSDAPGDRYRLYEIAGMPHGLGTIPTNATVNCNGPQQTSPFPGIYVANNALDKLIRWVDKGIVPPRADRLATVGDNPFGPLDKDANENAKGGIRTTALDVPIAGYHTCNLGVISPADPAGYSFGISYQVPFTLQKLGEPYKSPGDYVRRVNRRLNELIRDGWYLKEDADAIRADAVPTAKAMKKQGARPSMTRRGFVP